MDTEVITWAGLALSFLGAFLISVFHVSLSSFSKIAVSRFLEDRDKDYRLRLLKNYDETRLAVESLRIILLLAFLLYLFVSFPRLRFWPLWFFFIALGAYLLFFDVLPRFINSINKNAIFRFFLPAFGLVHLLLTPLLILVRLLQRKEPDEELREATEEEIETFIDEAREEGIIEKGEDALLRGVVEFGDIVVKEIMTPRVDMVCIRKDATIEEVRRLLIKEKFSRIPVYKDRIDNIEGIVIVKDILPYTDEKHKDMSIEPLMRPVHFVPESMEVSELLKEFQKRKQKLAIVVDEHGGVSGLVTIEDLVEEIVGEIQDEYDQDEESPIKEIGPSEYEVSGDVEVEEVEDLFDVDIAADNYITIGGLISHALGRLPKKGEKFTIKGLSFEILEVDQKRIIKSKIKKVEVKT